MTVDAKDRRSGLKKADRKEILESFGERYPGRRLVALQLDGFSHTVVSDDGTKEGPLWFDDVSFCMGEQEELSYCPEGKRERLKAARAFLTDIGYTGHSQYQGNALEIVFVQPQDR